jgi:hypothetical protein
MVDIPAGFRPISSGAPDDLMESLWWQESRNNPNAVSPRGAMGVGQVMPATARAPGYGIEPLREPFDPEQNKRFSRQYLGAMLNEFGGDEEAALVAYNWGPGNARSWVAQGKDYDALPAETRDYVQNIQSSRLREPARLGPSEAPTIAVPEGFRPIQTQAPAQEPVASPTVAEVPSGYRNITGTEQPPQGNVVPSSGVTIAEKGRLPREATAAEAQPYLRANLLPLARNQNTGQAELAVPGFLERAITAPGRALSGDLPTQDIDPATGEVHASPQAIQEAANVAAVAAPLSPARAGGVGWAGAQRTQPRPAPTTAALKEASQAAYKEAESAGLSINPQSFRKAAIEMATAAKRANLDKDLHPKATAVLNRIISDADSGQPITLEQVDMLRQMVRDAAKTPGEGRITTIIKDRIDDFLEGLTSQDVNAANPQAAVGALKEGRALWRQKVKSETIDTMLERAGIREGQFSVSGKENAIRTEFRQLAMRLAKDKREAGRWTPEEQKLIKQLGNMGSAVNILRTIGKLSPRSVFTLGGGGLSLAYGSPALTLGMWGVGEATRAAALGLTKKKVRELGSLVRRPGQTNALALPRPSNALAAPLSYSVRPPFLDDRNERVF